MIKKNLLLILLISAIALFPSFSAGKLGGGKIIELRIEDFLIVVLGLIWLANFLISGRKKLEKPPLFFPILVWLGIGFLSTLTNYIFTNYSFDQPFFYFLKEVEFFVFYFYTFYQIKNIESAKLLMKVWLFLTAINVGYVVYQLVTGSLAGEYGTAALSEKGVFPGGSFFLLLFIFLINVFFYYFLDLNIPWFKKAIIGFFSLSPVLGVFGSCSKTNFLAFVFALSLTLFFLFLKKKSLKPVLISILILILIIPLFISVSKNVPSMNRILPKLSLEQFFINYNPSRVLERYVTGRWVYITPWFEKISGVSLFALLIGFGKGLPAEFHNQYVRNFLETGIIGSLAFLFLIFVIIKIISKSYLEEKDPFLTGLSAGLLIATFTMLFFSMAVEAFIVVKCASVYWSFAGITMAALTLNKQNKNQYGVKK